jgi:hypothetical protein
MALITSALKNGRPRSKGYRLQKLQRIPQRLLNGVPPSESPTIRPQAERRDEEQTVSRRIRHAPDR